MSFKKKIWVNVPDETNLPDVPEGQDALARFDADNMNRIEEGLDESHTSLNDLISKINTSEMSVKRDYNGTAIMEKIHLDDINDTFSLDRQLNLSLVDTYTIFTHNLDILLDGYQPNMTISGTCGYRDETSGGHSSVMKVRIIVTDESGRLRREDTISICGYGEYHSVFSIALDSSDVSFLYEEKPLLKIIAEFYIESGSDSGGFIRPKSGAVLLYDLGDVYYTKAKRNKITIN